MALIDPENGQMKRLTRSSGHDFCPTWSSDGKGLAWIRIPPEGPRFLAVGDATGRGRSMLGQGFSRITEPDWEPKGRRIAFAAQSPGQSAYDLWIASSESR